MNEKPRRKKPEHWGFARGHYRHWGSHGAVDDVEKPKPAIPTLEVWTEADIKKHAKFAGGEQTYLRRLGVLVPSRSTLPWVYTDASVHEAYRLYTHAVVAPQYRGRMEESTCSGTRLLRSSG